MDLDIIQEEIDKKNQSYWNELCGTPLAQYLGVVDSSPESLEKFDTYYMQLYPYLKNYVPTEHILGKKVLEVGLGYGTMGQYLACHGAEYHGLDIAENAVKMTKHRLEQNNLSGQVVVDSMIHCPFPDNYFDYVVSIGCFHHTGNMQRCIEQTYRVLKPGGNAVIMVYNKFSLRQWVKWPKITTKNLVSQLVNKDNRSKALMSQRQAYDASINDNVAAPETEFFSKKEIKNIFSSFKRTKVTCENFDDYFKWNFLEFGARSNYLDSIWARRLGLDLYIQATK
jgi:ubiquinone/menaquinone biosynthesis C-methylase UbiE